jgi:hypothetical protein
MQRQQQPCCGRQTACKETLKSLKKNRINACKETLKNLKKKRLHVKEKKH